MSTKISVIIPAYNEEKTIISILEKVNAQKAHGLNLETIVIDDCSKDRTLALLEARPDLYSRLVKMPRNGGKGAAVKAGLKAATGEYILFQDADLEYDPADYPMLLHPIFEFNCDLVVGSRFLAPRYTRVAYFWHKLGNGFITLFFNILHNTTFSDIYTCYIAYRRELVNPDELKTSGWQQQAEILSHVVNRGTAFYETPISYHGRTYEEGKKIRAIHVLGVLKEILIGVFRT